MPPNAPPNAPPNGPPNAPERPDDGAAVLLWLPLGMFLVFGLAFAGWLLTRPAAPEQLEGLEPLPPLSTTPRAPATRRAPAQPVPKSAPAREP